METLEAKMPRRREPPEVRRDQILDAAQQVLLAKGLHSATVADVAAAAGIAKGTVYLHFESKTEVLAGLRARHVDRFSQSLTTALSATGRAKASTRLDRFIDEFFDYSVEHRALHHLLFHEAGFSEDDAFRQVKSILREFVSEGISTGDFAAVDTDVATEYLISGIHGSLVKALHTETSRAKILAATKLLSRRLVVI